MDAYEIQVYDGTANDPGRPGIELHANRDTRARETHLTFEPSYGVTQGWEIGAYLQSGLRDLQKRHKSIGDVRGRGLMLGVEIVEPANPAAKVPSPTRSDQRCLSFRGTPRNLGRV